MRMMRFRGGWLWAGLFALLCACAPHDAPEPSIAYGQWTALTLGYSQCIARAPGALRSAGYASSSQTFRGWFGSAGPTSATIVCYALGKGSIVTINVASNAGLDTANASLGKVAFGIFGTTPSSCTSPVGSWNWFNGLVVKINADSTATDPSGESGTWQSLGGGRFRLHWTANGTDEVTLSSDGNSLDGTFDGTQHTVRRTSQC
jgi:hypothetical protein